MTNLGKVKHTTLLQNYPNPFNPETWLPYALAEAADVTIRIYNLKGELIRLQRALADDAPLPSEQYDTRADAIAIVKARIVVLEEVHILSMRLENSKRRNAQLRRQNLAGPKRLAKAFR